jgi:hypothetical protein
VSQSNICSINQSIDQAINQLLTHSSTLSSYCTSGVLVFLSTKSLSAHSLLWLLSHIKRHTNILCKMTMTGFDAEPTAAPFYENGFPAGVGTDVIAKRQPWREILKRGHPDSALADACCKPQVAKTTLAGTNFALKTVPWQPEAQAAAEDRDERRTSCGEIRLLEELDAKSRK